ncbi:MAG: acyltransferase [Archaeoglobus sp.]|nr:acyltransferase [Archaeoglobus sp.]
MGSYITPHDLNFKRIKISDNVVIGDHSSIYAKEIIIGEATEIKRNVKIWGRGNFITGRKCYIDHDTYLDVRNSIIMGDKIGIGPGCMLFTHGIFHSDLEGWPARFGSIVIEDNAWIPARVFIMPGVKIGKNALIGSGSIVTKDVPENTFVAGSPAKVLGTNNPEVKVLSPADKNKILMRIMDEFIFSYDDRISILNKSDDILIFKIRIRSGIYSRQALVVYSYEINEKVLDSINSYLGEHRIKDVVVIAVEFPEDMKDVCSRNNIIWFDVGKKQRHNASNKLVKLICGIFADNGVEFEFE